MAYGVKYRLEFSDVLGYGKKVEILKKDYTGEILPMIGTGDPVSIEWNSKDDFYTPIIGSKCTLNLLVTDAVQYDDFYKFDEREYKIKVSYSKKISEQYTERIVQDGGRFESINCVDSFLGDFYTLSTYYENRVLEDGGKVESLNCVSESIEDEKINVYGDYWTGFVVVDRFTEKMLSTPYPISLNAFDGLGTLNDFNAPITPNKTQLNNNSLADIQRISNILENLDLDFDINCVNDIKSWISIFSGSSYPINYGYQKFPYFVSFKGGLQELKTDYGLWGAKQMLEKILSIYNMRIFQSFSKWYICEASNLFDQTVKDDIYNELQASNGIVPTNIREKITLQLKGNKQEFIETLQHNYLGNTKPIINEPVVYLAPKDLKPLKSDLTREYLQPLATIGNNTKINYLTQTNTNLAFDYPFYNSSFEYGLEGFVISGNYAQLATNEKSLKGKNSIKLTSSAPKNLLGVNSVNCINCLGLNSVDILDISDFSVEFNYYVEVTGKGLQDGNHIIQYNLQYNYDGIIYHFDNTNKEWTNTYNYTDGIAGTEYNKYQKVKINLNVKNLPETGPDSGILQLVIKNTYTTSTNYVTTYFDNIIINPNKSEQPDNDPYNLQTKNITGDLFTSKKVFSDDFNGNSPKFFRTRDDYGTNPDFFGEFQNNLYDNIHIIKNQNIINDFRKFVIRYNGTFLNLNSKPLSIHNKIWFNWPGVIEDEQASIIDGLKYNVKRAEYKVKAHVPNDDNDADVDLIIS